MRPEVQQAIATAWSKPASAIPRMRFWQSPAIVRHINKTVCGEAIDGANEGGLRVLADYYRKATGREMPVLTRALSIGAGAGGLEMRLIERGLVRHFDLFELAPSRVRTGLDVAARRGLSAHVRYHTEDFFTSASVQEGVYDLVFWHGALHHMMRARQAVLVSRAVLKPGGVFYCNDFVGATRFQWSDAELDVVNTARAHLHHYHPEIFHIADAGLTIPPLLGRPTVEDMIADDPSEAADSANILPSVRAVFPDAHIVQSGGLIYHLCLNDILTNIPEESPLLRRMLALDDECIARGFEHYALAIGVK